MPDFGTTLKNLLDDRGISQKWLADAAGTNKSSRLDILASIAKALNVSTDYLLGITDVPQRKSELTAEEFILISAFRRASERDANIIWSILGTYLTPSEHELIDAQQENK